MTGDCCSVEVVDDEENTVIQIYRSKGDNNVHSPLNWPDGWELVE